MTECNETFECFAEEPKVYESEEEHFNDIFAGYEADHQKALALIDWQKEQIKSLETAIKVYRSCLEHNNLDPKLYDAGYRKQSEGEWITDEEGYVTCSVCGEEHTWDEFRPPYCDMCGAKMKGGAE